jgi:hypothetical protein
MKQNFSVCGFQRFLALYETLSHTLYKGKLFVFLINP